jgi:hypothetical protein
VFALLKKRAGKAYLIAVNAAPRELDATLRAADLPAMVAVKPIFGSPMPTSVDREAKVVGAHMPAQGVAVYEIRLR